MPRTDALHYYVDLRRGKRVALLAGPYDTLTEAMAGVEKAVALAVERDPFAHFDLFGTCHLPKFPWNPKGVFNSQLGLDNL